MNKKKIIIIVSIILLICIIGIIRIISNNEKRKTTTDDFFTIKELVEFDGHKYISEKKSSENGFEKDIFIEFSTMPISEDGTVNQGEYEVVIKHIGEKLLGHNFRIIDESKQIIVRIKFEGNEVKEYTINNDKNYWKNLSKTYKVNSVSKDSTNNLTITSRVLLNIINNDWEYDNLNLGTKDSECQNYDIYFDEGYKIRTINTKIYNIIFTTNYKEEILGQITTNMTHQSIQQVLGKPSLKSNTGEIIGYKGKDIYVFFTNNEISVYPIDKYNETENEKFSKLVTELNKTADINTFLNKLTDLYSDYETYYRTDSNILLSYPLRGFEVVIGTIENNGITLYNNYKGNVTENVTIDDIKQNKASPANVYLELDNNLVLKSEDSRIYIDKVNRNPYFSMEEVKTNEYAVIENNGIYSFYSRDKTGIDSELKINDFTNILNYGQSVFIYGVKNDGIYKYDAKNRRLEQIYKGQGEFQITKIENNIVYYDNTMLQL